MLQCWEFEPKKRPTFSNLVKSLSKCLETVAGYVDIGALSPRGITPELSEEATVSNPSASDAPVERDSLDKEPMAMEITCDETSV